jgi:hypothetical protein
MDILQSTGFSCTTSPNSVYFSLSLTSHFMTPPPATSDDWGRHPFSETSECRTSTREWILFLKYQSIEASWEVILGEKTFRHHEVEPLLHSNLTPLIDP